MNKIRLLEQDVIDKIAAGEVIQRPLSVVKELLENSLDANAGSITIRIEQGGISFVQVIDNGEGMSSEDALMCLKKHTTSKISKSDDLFSVTSLGFRGEALASIVNVSRMNIRTQRTHDETGILIEENMKIKQINMPAGTIITVRDLFYNMPARRKHLKKASAEARLVISLVEKYALAYPCVSFTLINDGEEIISAPATEDDLGNIINVFGREVGKNLIPIELDAPFKLSGYIGKPAINHSDKSMIICFINGRYVKNKGIIDAVAAGYKNLLNTARFPVAIISLTLAAGMLDVNVHPAKTIIRLLHEDYVCSQITDAVIRTLESVSLVSEKQMPSSDSHVISKYRPMDSSQSFQQVLCASAPAAKQIISEPAYRIIGILHKMFIIVETMRGMRLVDFHAANERVLYEELKEKNMEIEVQKCIEPAILELTPAKSLIIKDMLPKLSQLGFFLEPFGMYSFLLRRSPVVIGKQLGISELKETITDIENNCTLTVEQLRHDLLHTKACRASFKAGDSVSLFEAKELIDKLMRCRQKHSCPHGRPTMVDFTLRDFEKAFNRIRGYESEKTFIKKGN